MLFICLNKSWFGVWVEIILITQLPCYISNLEHRLFSLSPLRAPASRRLVIARF